MFNFLNIFNKKEIRYASFGSVLIKFGSAFFAFLNGILLTRFLGVDEFGYYILAFSTAMLLSVPVTAGLPQLITRYVSKYEVYNDYASIKGLLIKTNNFVLWTTLAIFVIVGITYWFWWSKYDPVLVETLLYSIILLPLLGFGALRNASLRGMKLVILSELPDTILRNLLFTVFIVIAVLANVELSPQKAIIFQVIAAGISFCVGYVFLHRKLLSRLRKIVPVFKKKEWLKQTIPFTINSGVQAVKSRSLIFILAIFGSIEAVAIFEVAMRGAALVSFVLDALNNAIAPFISSAFEMKDMARVQHIAKKTSRIIFLFSLPVALIFIVGGRPLLELIFGQGYEASYVPLVVLCIAQLVSALVGSVGLILNMTGHQNVFSKSNVLALLLTLVLSIPLVIMIDVTGAALVYGTILVLQNIILLKFVSKELRINTTVF